MDENKDAGKIFQQCRSQVIMTGMGDIIDINILAVKAIMDIEGINDQKSCLEKVRLMFNWWQKNREKNKEDDITG